MKNWTEKDLQRMLAAGTIQGWTEKNCRKPAENFQKPQKNTGKPAKYGNKKVEWDGIIFDSKKEYARYRELLVLQTAGIIRGLQRQVIFMLDSDGQHVCNYIADHMYTDVATGQLIVEDVKSKATRKLPAYRLKNKLMKSVFNIQIKEI